MTISYVKRLFDSCLWTWPYISLTSHREILLQARLDNYDKDEYIYDLRKFMTIKTIYDELWRRKPADI